MGISVGCVYVTEKREGMATYSRRIYERTDFPNYLGAVDGKHTRLCKPDDSRSLFFNYKNFFSTVLMVLIDTDYCFMSIDV